MAGNNYPYNALRGATNIAGTNKGNAMLASSEVDGMSQISCSRSAMIRQRGQFPKTIWQRGAMYSTKKSRKEVSMGNSPAIRKKAKANLNGTNLLRYKNAAG